ncbi:hypothetical protein HZB97_01475 [Candidatus Gottesmanbacteria bacterium]|nr:hypothetical protein [Candidatus Gottesmanbacteria bacterium]
MPQVSKYPVSTDVYNRIFEILFNAIAEVKSPYDVREFFEDFLSPTERIMLAKRLAIAVLLAKNYDYRAISKILRVSPATIAAVNVFFRYAGQGYKKVVKRILNEEKQEEFWNKLDDLLSETIPPRGRNWTYWRQEREKMKRERRKPF